MIAIASKHLLAYKKKPAAGLLLTVPFFHAEQSWWGAFGDLPVWTIAFLLADGYWITNRVRKFPQVFSFFGMFFFLMLVMGIFHVGNASDAFRPPFINAALFFGFFMLTDPPTSPAKVRSQLVYGVIAAVTGAIIYGVFGGLMYLFIGLLAGNLYHLLKSRLTHPTKRNQYLSKGAFIMSRKKTVWIPAILSVVAVILLLVYYLYTRSSHGGGAIQPHPPRGGEGNWQGGGNNRPPIENGYAADGLFSTLGTVSIYVAAAGFSWFWFKKKLKSPAKLLRQAGKLFHAAHKLFGWLTLFLITVHGAYFLITKLHDEKIFTGMAAFAILLAIAGYGYFIPKIRNKWMRSVHRSLGVVWVPVLWLHAGGSAIIATIITIAIGGLVAVLHKRSSVATQPIQDR